MLVLDTSTLQEVLAVERAGYVVWRRSGSEPGIAEIECRVHGARDCTAQENRGGQRNRRQLIIGLTSGQLNAIARSCNRRRYELPDSLP